MEISKVSWLSEGNNLKLSMPIAKIDIEKRVVSGFATLDNIDRQGDIVPSEASVKAFEDFRGNIREMHDDKKAVGKLISFKEDSFYDEETEKFYKGVFVSTYVSKGAQDTWEKVLDGTLTGFSIGGRVKDYEDTYNEEMDKSVRTIKEYDLFELSLVDNPANQYANVISIEKNNKGGYLLKALIENVFWCDGDGVVQLNSENASICPRCDKNMSNIGFVETNDAQKAEVVKSILSTVKKDAKEVSKMNNDEITKEDTEETAETVVEKSVELEVEESHESEVEKSIVEDEVLEESTEKISEEMEKGSIDEEVVEELAKSLEKEDEPAQEELSLSTDSDEGDDDKSEPTKALVDEIHSTFSLLADTIKSLNEKVEELNKTVTGVRSDVESVKNDFGKRVDAVEKDTAFRKSGDLGEVVQEPIFEKAQKTPWGGRFLTKSDLFS